MSAPPGVWPSPNFAQERSSLEAPPVVKNRSELLNRTPLKCVKTEFPETWLWTKEIVK